MAAGGGLGVAVLALVVYLLGGDPRVVMQSRPAAPQQPQARTQAGPPDEMSEFVKVVLGDTEDVWGSIFRQAGRDYQEPQLVLFSGAVQSACGFAQSAMGPFYCPRDGRVYIDLSFFDQLRERFRAPGDFAQAYVIAHEVGHHVQHILGITQKVEQVRARWGTAFPIQVEVDTLAQLEEALACRVASVLLDNMTPEQLRRAVAIAGKRCHLEASGGITLANVRAIAETGIDSISLGGLTHSARSLDLGLDIA